MLYLNILLATAVTGAYVQAPLPCPGVKPKSEPGWKKDNKQLLIPLSEKARTGLLNEAAEEGLIRAVGPRFANAFYEVDEAVAPEKSKCMATVVATGLCLVACRKSPKKDCPLRCGKKELICACLPYFVQPIQAFLKQSICKNPTAIDFDDSEIYSPYVEYLNLAQDSIALQAVRGDIYKSQIEQLKDIAAQSSKEDSVVCPLGFESCGDSCPCCVGACFMDDCMGACI